MLQAAGISAGAFSGEQRSHRRKRGKTEDSRTLSDSAESEKALEAARRRRTGMEHRRAAAVVVAAGQGERARRDGAPPKQYRRIGGVPVLTRTLRALDAHPAIDRLVVVIGRDSR